MRFVTDYVSSAREENARGVCLSTGVRWVPPVQVLFVQVLSRGEVGCPNQVTLPLHLPHSSLS